VTLTIQSNFEKVCLKSGLKRFYGLAVLYTQYSTYHVDVLVYAGLEHGGVIMTIIIILSRTVRVNSKIEVIFFLFYMSSCWLGSETGVWKMPFLVIFIKKVTRCAPEKGVI